MDKKKLFNHYFCQRFQSIALLLVSLISGFGYSSAFSDTFTLNLKNADISSFISTVSKQTGKNFVVDPRVKAKVTVISSREMDADELYEVFLSVLQVHQFSAVPTGDVIKIIPDVSAKQSPVPDLVKGSRKDQLVTHVINIENVPAAQLVPILRPLVPQQGHLAAYAATNALIITDRAANIGRITKIIKRIDRPDNEEIEVVQLENASASEVVRILGALKPATKAKGANTPGNIKLAADERTNSILISGDRAARLRTRSLIAHLDTPTESGGNTRVVYLRYSKAEDLAKVLKGVSEGQAKVGVAGQPQTAQARANASKQKESVDIQADEHTNSLIITAPPDQMRNILAIIRQLDIRRAQVLIEAIIAEISQNKSNALGVSFATNGIDKGAPAGVINLGNMAAEIASAVANPANIGLGSTLAIGDVTGDIDFGFIVRAIASDAANNILSTPSLVTLDNQEAEIVVGQNVPFVTGQTTSSSNDNPFQTIERQDVGLTLKVLPQINEGNSIKMDISKEISNVTSQANLANAVDLVTQKRAIKTTVIVEDGQTLVLGGLIDETLRDTREKVPLLGDIPLLGRLFQYRGTEKAKQNLMMFMRPVILRDRTLEDYHSSRKYNFLRTQQLLSEENSIGLLKGEGPVLPELEVLFNNQPVKRSSSGRESGEVKPEAQLKAPLPKPLARRSVDPGPVASRPSSAGIGNTVQAVRHSESSVQTRLVFDLQQPVASPVQKSTSQAGVAIFRLKNTVLGDNITIPAMPIAHVDNMALEQRGDDVFLFLRPAADTALKHYELNPGASPSHRLVIDIMPKSQ
ncbi:MAG: type II secretion system secretin GspD [Gammaproteobacteria bacterium]|nr:type II secretion system secretin GspD [Gammaproteobacteria bacterium]